MANVNKSIQSIWPIIGLRSVKISGLNQESIKTPSRSKTCGSYLPLDVNIVNGHAFNKGITTLIKSL